ncbi:MAG: glycosyltransferase family 39 protein [Nitrospirae bacterium]|nr:glycosyltransferase family 39 protein [Nitrospirota bacterium]
MINSSPTNAAAGKKYIIAISIFVLLASLVFILAKARFDSSIPFLPSDGEASWISFPLEQQTKLREGNYVDLIADFRNDIALSSPPVKAVIGIQAMRLYRIWVNGREIPVNPSQQANWKHVSEIDLNGYLAAGPNSVVVSVHNASGPPALWIAADDPLAPLSSGASWRVSLSGGPMVPAVAADDDFRYPAADAHSPTSALASTLPTLALLFALSFVLYWWNGFAGSRSGVRNHRVSRHLRFTPETVLAIALAFWAVLFARNFGRLPIDLGFDGREHLDHIRFLLDKGHLPSASDGWEMYQPPLYYLLSAVLVKFASIFLPMDTALYAARLVPFLSGVGQIVLVWLAARLLLPENATARMFAVATAAVVPMNIYISHYASNESLSAGMIALSLLLALRVAYSREMNSRSVAILGLSCGLALLSKFTALLVVPVILAAVMARGFSRENGKLPDAIKPVALIVLVVAIVSGWFYIRNWSAYGNPLVGNWDAVTGMRWWQDPGYHTSGYFMRFGRVFESPYFSGFHSFWDSIYSTFWGDGDIGGKAYFRSRPPWNYDYMSAVYLLAAPVTFIFAGGLVSMTRRAYGDLDVGRLAVLWSGYALAFGVVYINLKLPFYGQAKAFYALAGMLPFSLICAEGFSMADGFFERRRLDYARAALRGWFGMLAGAVFLSFFSV